MFLWNMSKSRGLTSTFFPMSRFTAKLINADAYIINFAHGYREIDLNMNLGFNELIKSRKEFAWIATCVENRTWRWYFC